MTVLAGVAGMDWIAKEWRMARSARFRAAALTAAAAIALLFSITGVTSAAVVPDPYNTGVTVNPLKAACESNAPTCDHVGTTNAYFNGEDVKFLYSQDFYCDRSVASHDTTTGCEAGAKYNKVPPGTNGPGATDPLYIPIPLFAKPGYIQCQAKPMCIDHPATLDLSAIAGSLPGKPTPASLYNAMLPGHDHIITDRNKDKPEWWPVIAVGVTSPAAWKAITTAKDYDTMKALEGQPNSGVTAEIPTNAFLWFQSLPGHITAQDATKNFTEVPPAAPAGQAINNLKQECTTTVNGCVDQNSDFIGLTHDYIGGTDVDAVYSGPFFCDTTVSSKAPSKCEAGAKYKQVPPDITSDSFTDPLYIPVPLFSPGPAYLQCPAGKPCVDHPTNIDLSRLAPALGKPASALQNVALPGHDHIITDRNNNKPEWWPVVVVGVTNPNSFALISNAKNLAEVRTLQANPKNGVTPDIPTNAFLFFQTVPGAGPNLNPPVTVPVGPPQTGGGSTAGLQDKPLFGLGGALLLGAAGALAVAGRRRARTGA